MPTKPGRARSILRGGLLTLLISLLFCGGPLLALRHIGESFDYRCERHPPEESFHRFVSPSLRGISDIHAWGESWPGGANIFVRFQYVDAALADLTRGWEAQGVGDAEEVRAFVSELVTWQYARRAAADEEAVPWKELKALKKPQMYHRGTVGQCDYLLLIDRARHRAYFYFWSI